MATWFTSDQHFGHANIIGYCDRPFGDVEEMNAELVRRWNEVVRSDDTVYVLGLSRGRDYPDRDWAAALKCQLRRGSALVEVGIIPGHG